MSLAKVDNGVSYCHACFAGGEGFKAPYVEGCDGKDREAKDCDDKVE